MPNVLVPDPEAEKDKDQKKQNAPSEKQELLALPASAIPVEKGERKDDDNDDALDNGPAPSHGEEAEALAVFFKRLNISGCFQRALLRPDAQIIEVHPLTSGPPTKRLRATYKQAPGVPVKREPLSEIEKALMEEVNQALSQCNEVVIQEVDLPTVVVKVLGCRSIPSYVQR